jgi:hypothetical protein
MLYSPIRSSDGVFLLPERLSHAVFRIHYSFILCQVLLLRKSRLFVWAWLPQRSLNRSFRVQPQIHRLRRKEDLGPAAVQEGDTNLNSNVSIHVYALFPPLCLY